MKNLINAAVISLVAVSSNVFAAEPGVTFVPAIPVDCYDGLPHKEINAISNLMYGEESDYVKVTYLNYQIDCHQKDGVMNAAIRGPFHEDRCDISVRPYAGVRVESHLVALPEPYSSIKVCSVGLSFEKKFLKPNADNPFIYVYRQTSNIGDYNWYVNLKFNSATGKFEPAMAQIPHVRNRIALGSNEDRNPRGWAECNERTAVSYPRLGWIGVGVESVVSEVVGNKLKISFYVNALVCSANELSRTGFGWVRDSLPSGHWVELRSSVGSNAKPEPYDWKRYREMVPNTTGEKKVEYTLDLEEVVKSTELKKFRNGEIANADFRIVFGGNNKVMRGEYNLVVNLDPKDKKP